jgi:hypothetical protein
MEVGCRLSVVGHPPSAGWDGPEKQLRGDSARYAGGTAQAPGSKKPDAGPGFSIRLCRFAAPIW